MNIKAKVLAVAVALSSFGAQGGVQPYIIPKPVMADYKGAKVYDCLELIFEIGDDGLTHGVSQQSRAILVDFGDMFLVRNKAAESFALSGGYKYDRAEFRGDYPQPGIFMGRGFGMEGGRYNYISDRAIIEWDCRK